jgi:hypothetical protein
MIPLEIHQSLKILSAHAKACAWFFKTPGLDPAPLIKKEHQGSFCEGLIPKVAKSSKVYPNELWVLSNDLSK